MIYIQLIMESIRSARRRLLNLSKIHITASRSKSYSLDYCVDAVRQYDYENFLATLLLHESVRSPSLVVRAFNVEVARVQDQTTDLHTAEFRLQFWKDTVQKIFVKGQSAKNIPAHPIAQELFNIHLSGTKIQKRQLDKLVQSRNAFLRTKYFRTLEEIEKYSDETVSTLYYLILSMADIQNVNADHVASHLGKAQGIVNLLRSVHISSTQKIVTLPLDVLAKHGVSQEDVLRTKDSSEMRDVAFEMASRANTHLEKARNIKVPKDASTVFLPAVAVSSYLQRLQKLHFNIYDKTLYQRQAILPFKLYYSKFLNKY